MSGTSRPDDLQKSRPLAVVKIGGALVTEFGAPDVFWRSLIAMQDSHRVVLVHGGGPHATRVARMIGHEPRFIHGRRVTSDLDLEIVQWTMRGSLNIRLVAQAHQHALRAVGLSGADDGMVRVHRRPPRMVDGESVDFGFVGDVDAVDSDMIRLLLDAGRLPVIAPMGMDENGLLYNVNADTVALEFAVSLSAGVLCFVADSGGVRRNPAEPSSVLSVLEPADHDRGIAEGWISAGMRTKLETAAAALERGVGGVRISGPEDFASGGGTLVVGR